MDGKTGRPLAADEPEMKIMLAAWDAAPLEEQQAFFNVTVKNSRDARDLELLQKFIEKVEAAGRAARGN